VHTNAVDGYILTDTLKFWCSPQWAAGSADAPNFYRPWGDVSLHTHVSTYTAYQRITSGV